MKKRVFALLLTLVMFLSVFSGIVGADEIDPLLPEEPEEPEQTSFTVEELGYDRENFTVVNFTPLSGDFFTTMWGNGTADLDVKKLLHGYPLTQFDPNAANFTTNDDSVTGLIITNDSDGNKEYNIFLYDDLYYSDGSRITASDYAFSILLQLAPEVAEIGGNRPNMDYIIGAKDYFEGKADNISGIRVVNDEQLKITVDKNAFPYYYELSYIDVNPYPISVIAPGCKIVDDGEGAHIDGDFTAELLEKTILDPETGYLTHPSVVSGTYTLASYEDGVAEFAINTYHKGSEEAPFKNVKYFSSLTDEAAELLKNGEVTMVHKAMNSESIEGLTQLLEDGKFAMSAYPRNGLCGVSFNCEKPAVADKAVRQAIAMCMDKDSLSSAMVGNYGTVVDGYYGVGQWMYQVISGAMEYPMTAAEIESQQVVHTSTETVTRYEEKTTIWEDADGSAHMRVDQVPVTEQVTTETVENVLLEKWQALNLNSVKTYPFVPGEADKALTDTGWEKNEQTGKREKKIDGKIVPMDLTLAVAEESPAISFLKNEFTNSLAEAGITLTVVTMPWDKLLKQYYREEERDCDMFFLATNFEDDFNPTAWFSPSDDAQGVQNKTGIRSEELYATAVDLVRTTPGDTLGYATKWITFVEAMSEEMPFVPVYSNIYFDYYTACLQGYDPTSVLSWADCIYDLSLEDVDTSIVE